MLPDVHAIDRSSVQCDVRLLRLPLSPIVNASMDSQARNLDLKLPVVDLMGNMPIKR